MLGKSSLADGINHQNPHISKHLFAHKTSSTSIELDVDDKRKPMRKTPEEQIEIEGAKSTPTALSDLIGLEAIWRGWIWSGSGWSGFGKTAIWIGLD
jgi:hypothetical protein